MKNPTGDPTRSRNQADGRDRTRIVDRRSKEWEEHQLRWTWLMDSYEGGQRYREAIYGIDIRGVPVRNLIRHKREYPDAREQAYANTSIYLGGTSSAVEAFAQGVGGQDQAQNSSDDDYELRRARTPVPTFVAEAIATHLGEVYAKEVRRDIPEGPEWEPLRDWMLDVDGKGSDFATWMAEDVAPLMMVLGQLDLCFDHPPAPEGTEVVTRADQDALGLARCVASIILPEHMIWWKLTPSGAGYTECLVREYLDPDDPGSGEAYRHWTATGSTLYSGSTSGQDLEIIATHPHPFGMVPIVRVFDRRKPRCRNIGQSRYESIAERQREYYNRDSELILSDSTHAHPLLQGPEDYVQADGMIPIGPSWLLPKKKNTSGGSVSYEGFEVVDFPKGTADSIRQNMAVIRDDVDRDGAFTKPAGASGTGRSTVSQSGVSKALDAQAGTRKLSSIATSLARAEARIIAHALLVLTDGPDALVAAREVQVVYPTDYNLFSATDLAAIASDVQDLIAGSGKAPETESLLITQLVRSALPGFDDETYERLEAEIESAVNANADKAEESAESGPTRPVPPGLTPFGSEDEPDAPEVAGDQEGEPEHPQEE